MSKKSSKQEAKNIISALPKEVKEVIVAMAGATMDAWEMMTEEEKAEYGGDVCTYLGAQILLGAKFILEEED